MRLNLQKDYHISLVYLIWGNMVGKKNIVEVSNLLREISGEFEK